MTHSHVYNLTIPHSAKWLLVNPFLQSLAVIFDCVLVQMHYSVMLFWERFVHALAGHSSHSPVAKPQIFGEPCNTIHTKFFCCFYISEVCSLRIWMMPFCHPWAIPPICKLRPP